MSTDTQSVPLPLEIMCIDVCLSFVNNLTVNPQELWVLDQLPALGLLDTITSHTMCAYKVKQPVLMTNTRNRSRGGGSQLVNLSLSQALVLGRSLSCYQLLGNTRRQLCTSVNKIMNRDTPIHTLGLIEKSVSIITVRDVCCVIIRIPQEVIVGNWCKLANLLMIK